MEKKKKKKKKKKLKQHPPTNAAAPPKTIRTGVLCWYYFQSQMRWKSAANWRADVAQVKQLASPVCCINNGTLRHFGEGSAQPLIRNSPRWRTEVLRRFLLTGPIRLNHLHTLSLLRAVVVSYLTGEVCVSKAKLLLDLCLRRWGNRASRSCHTANARATIITRHPCRNRLPALNHSTVMPVDNKKKIEEREK